MSRFAELLAQIPPGKEEISEDLEKELKRAAFRLAVSRNGQYDISPEEREELNDEGCEFTELVNPRAKWEERYSDEWLLIFEGIDGISVGGSLAIGKGRYAENKQKALKKAQVLAKQGKCNFRLLYIDVFGYKRKEENLDEEINY